MVSLRISSQPQLFKSECATGQGTEAKRTQKAVYPGSSRSSGPQAVQKGPVESAHGKRWGSQLSAQLNDPKGQGASRPRPHGMSSGAFPTQQHCLSQAVSAAELEFMVL